MSTMTTKLGTKTFSDNPQAPIERDVPKLTEDQKKRLGEEDMAAVLNKVSDPNWVDPSKKVKGVGNNALDKEAFFKLMLTQLKNQDPTNPLKNHEMAAQLAQFSTLEQMSNMNNTLTKIEGKNAPTENFQALNLIGKSVAGDSSKVVRTPFDTNHDFNFNLVTDAHEAKIKVMDSKGEIVREYKMNELKQGPNKISWNGMNDKGAKLPAGEYKFQIEANNSAGQKLQVKTEFSGVISGMSFSPEGPVLQVGNQTIKMRDVRQITDSSLMKNDQKVNDVTNLDLKKSEQIEQPNIKQGTNTSANANLPPPGSGNVMTDVAMDRPFMEQLQKETK